MLRDVIHGMRETKQETTILAERAIELFTTAQKPSEPIDGYYKIVRRETKQETAALAERAIELYSTR